MNVPPQPTVRKITNTANKYIRHCIKLRTTKRHREECQRLLIVGEDILQEISDNGIPVKAQSLFLREDLHLEGDFSFAEHVYAVTENVMKKLVGLKSAQALGAAAEFDIPQPSAEWMSSRVVAMDGIQDPGNFGSLLRTCVSLGWGPVLLLPNCVDPYNDKALRAARGATFKISLYPVAYEDLHTLLETKNLVAIGATVREKGMLLEDVAQEMEKREKGMCLFLGSEGRGLSNEVQELCERFVTIPQSTQMESLNVAVAGGILMYSLNTTLRAIIP